MLVICLTLGVLYWQISLNATPDLLFIVGVVTVTSLAFTRFFRRLGLPSLLGAICAGIIIAKTEILTPDAVSQLDFFYQFAWAWAGLFLCAGLSSKTFKNIRLLKGSLCLYTPPVVLVLIFLTFHSWPFTESLAIALISGMPMILFLEPQTRANSAEIITLGKLTTVFGFICWGLLSLDLSLLSGKLSLFENLLHILLYVLVLEGTVWICKGVRTERTKHMVLFGISFLFAIASFEHGISAFFIAFPAGLFLSLRKATPALLRTHSLAEAILAFLVAVFSLHVFHRTPVITDYSSPYILALYVGIVLLGKVSGGILAEKLLKFAAKDWLPSLPIGLVGCFFFNTQSGDLLAPNGFLHPLVFLVFITSYFVYPVITIIWHKIKKGPLSGHKPTQRALSQTFHI